MKAVFDFCPNIDKDSEVLLFWNYACVEHHPYGLSSPLIGKRFADVCDLLEFNLPDDCNYMYLHRNGYKSTVKIRGAYSLIINSKKVFNV